MKFLQLNAIREIRPGSSIDATMALRGDEEYLKDHFPRFPVMPGVLMLEGLYQAAAILVRETLEYRPGLILLESARNVRFGDFLEPGQTLEIHVALTKQEENRYSCMAKATKDGETAVSARLVLTCSDAGQPAVVRRYANCRIRQIVEKLKKTGLA